MTLADDLGFLGRMNYRQVVMILLSGLVVWWLTSAVITLGAHVVWDLWRNAEPVSLGYAAFYVSPLAEPVSNVVSLIAGFWMGYRTFSKFKKAMV